MKRSWNLGLAIAGVTILAWTSPVLATEPTVLDTFDVNEGHFNSAPSFSGSNRNMDQTAGAMTADRVTTDGPRQGLGHEKIVLKTAASWATPPGEQVWYCRFLSGGGSASNNVKFTTSAETDGWIGFYAKTTQAGVAVQLWIEGPSNNNSSPKTLINDGQWHLYEWNLDDHTGGPDGWVVTPGILTGTIDVKDGEHTIDSIIFRSAEGSTWSTGQVLEPIYIDFVAISGPQFPSVADYLESLGCLNTPEVGGVDGPLQAGGTSVKVLGCSLDLGNNPGDAVSVYAEGVKIGELTSGFTRTGTEAVPVSGLVKGQRVVATQTLNGQESCVPSAATGMVVGQGNGNIKLSLSVRDKAGLSGPLGADGGTGAQMLFVGTASAAVYGPPHDGKLFSPSPCWQTVEFRAATGVNDDTLLSFANEDPPTIENLPWGVIEGLQVIIDPDAPNTGPYTIYIDDVENGIAGIMTGFEDGESQAVNLDDVNVLFSHPLASGSTSGGLLTEPNVSVVTDEHSYNGDRSLKLSWQWKNESPGMWTRLTTALNFPHAYQNPMVRLDQPIRMKILILPADQAPLPAPKITVHPVDITTVCPGAQASFSVTATGTGLTYQWSRISATGPDYVEIPGATGSTYNFTVSADDQGAMYRCVVSDANGCSAASYPARVDFLPVITQQPESVYACSGEEAVFTVAAEGVNLAYQWKENGVPLSDGNGISGATTATLTVLAAPERNGKAYTVTVGGCGGAFEQTSAAAVLNLANPSPAVITGGGVAALGSAVSLKVGAGFTGQYFTAGGTSPVMPVNGVPVFTRVDPLVNLDWASGSPDPGVWPGDADGFAVRWQAKVPVPVTGDYTFYTRTDDGVRLYVNGTLIIDHWVNQGNIEWCGPGTTAPGTCTAVPLVAGGIADIEMEFYENAGAAAALLSWEAVDDQGTPILAKQPVNPVPGQWAKDGVPLAGATSGVYNIPSMSGADAGLYTYTFTDPCSGATFIASTMLALPADFNDSGTVDLADIEAFIGCATGPDVPYATPLEAPCRPEMDADGDGDIDQDDFGRIQRRIGFAQ